MVRSGRGQYILGEGNVLREKSPRDLLFWERDGEGHVFFPSLSRPGA